MTTLSRPERRRQARALSNSLMSPSVAADLQNVFQREKPELSPWDAALEADREAQWDAGEPGTVSWGAVRRGLSRASKEQGEWAGFPLPMEGRNLVIDPTYPYAKAVEGLYRNKPEAHSSPAPRIINHWWDSRSHCDLYIWERDGKRGWGKIPAIHHLNYDLETIGAATAWALETENAALGTLRSVVTHHQFRQYVLTGSFLEHSKRSDVHYIFRRLKPTVAMNSVNDEMRVLAALCLHPIGYYAGSWAGAQCPTDDVLAHLMLMRGDEAMFWRRANQHPAYRPEAGL